MKTHKITSLAVIIAFMSPIHACAEGLDSLIEVARSQGEIAKYYADETRAYESMKRAIEAGKIAKGLNKKAVSGKCGEPVVMVGEYGTDREKWIYKPATSDFFEGPKISLFFTKDGVLDEIAIEK